MDIEEILYAVFGSAGGGGVLVALIALIKKVCDIYKKAKDEGESTAKAINITITTLAKDKEKPKGKKK